MTTMFPKKAPVKTPKTTTTPKSTLKTSKLQPFGAHYVTKLSTANNKLLCSLSATASVKCDIVSDGW
jgi:hypothetical protein